MTQYTVVRVESAQGDLAELWMNAPNRDAVTAATHAVDQELRKDAPAKGTELSEGLRALFVPPLKAIFTVCEEDRIAEVLRVRNI